MFGKNLVPGIWVKILSVSQISLFLSKRNLQNKSIKLPDFSSVDTKFWSTWLLDSRTGYISRMNSIDKSIFGMMLQIQESRK